MEYKVLEYTNLGILQTDVQKYIEKGFIPQGGIAVTLSAYGRIIYYQAMIKKEDKNG